MGLTLLQRHIIDEQRARRRAVGFAIRDARRLAGLSIRETAKAAAVDFTHLSRAEKGDAALSMDSLVAVGAVIGQDVSIKLFASTGPRVRDRIQALIVEAVLATLQEDRWASRLEVPVHRPVRGVIDLVLQEIATGLLVAGEAHSLLTTVEGQLRHAHEKQDALPTATGYPWQAAIGAPPASRLLVLRSSATMHELVATLPLVFSSAYPGDTAQAVAALRDQATPWPGPSIIWVEVNGARTRVLDDAPPKVARALRLATPAGEARSG